MREPDRRDEQRFAGALLRRAEEDRRRLLADAEAEGARLRVEAERQMAKLRAERLETSRRRAAERRTLRLSEERFATRVEETRVFDETRQRATDEARRRLGQIRYGPHYDGIIDRLITLSLSWVDDTDDVTFIVDARDQEAMARALGRCGLCGVAIEIGGPFLGGFQTRAASGRELLDHTFDARVRSRLPALGVRLAALLGEADTTTVGGTECAPNTTTSTPAPGR